MEKKVTKFKLYYAQQLEIAAISFPSLCLMSGQPILSLVMVSILICLYFNYWLFVESRKNKAWFKYYVVGMLLMQMFLALLHNSSKSIEVSAIFLWFLLSLIGALTRFRLSKKFFASLLKNQGVSH